jgi:hypothetical protein
MYTESVVQQIETALGVKPSDKPLSERVEVICKRIAVLRYENELIDILTLQQAANALTEGQSSARDHAIGNEIFAIIEALETSNESD